MRVLVTGAAGFVGSHTVLGLAAAGHEAVAFDNLETGRWENLSGAVVEPTVIEGDIRSRDQVAAAVSGCEAVLHLAARTSIPRSLADPAATNDVNVTGTLNVLLAARSSGVRRVVFASSSSVYGPSASLPQREGQPARPISPYAVGKLAGEGYCRSFAELDRLETVSLRYFNVFGPRQDPESQYAAAVPRFARAVLAGDVVTVFGDGRQSRDFTYVANVVAANLRAIEAPEVSGGVFNVACGDSFTVGELIEALGELTGRIPEVRYEERRPGDVRHSRADLSSARAQLGYRPTVSFRTGLARTLRALSERVDDDRARGRETEPALPPTDR